MLLANRGLPLRDLLEFRGRDQLFLRSTPMLLILPLLDLHVDLIRRLDLLVILKLNLLPIQVIISNDHPIILQLLPVLEMEYVVKMPDQIGLS